MKKVVRAVLIVCLVLILAFGGLVAWLSAVEYRPAAVEALEIAAEPGAGEALCPGELRILSWNIGYAGLGKEEDFFMDGGKTARPSDSETVSRYLAGIRDTLGEAAAPLWLLQEVDIDSHRSYGIDERTGLQRGYSAFALNYACPFVPVPIPPLGKVNCGLLTCSAYPISDASRVSLPCPFSWPIRTVNLKRCLLVSRLPIEGSERELVLVNLHLEAYDDGEGKRAQTEQLLALLREEYEKGNYVIAGGDFNQAFPGSLARYPIVNGDYWTPGVLEEAPLGEGWRLVCDLETPSCRLLNQPYDPSDTAHTQYYTIDGFILSPNVTLNAVETLDLGFENSDHNPVLLTVSLP